MLIPLHEIRLIFEKISKKSLEGGTTVVILCSYEVDSLCATQILSGLLKNDGIIYKIIPVSGYTDLENQLEKLKNQKELKSLIFINNGGCLDLTRRWFAENHRKIKAYVFDYHRPIHHSNVNSEKKIIMIDDGYYNIEEVPANDDFDVELDEDEDDDLSAGGRERDEENEEAEYGEEDKEEEEEEQKIMEIQMDKENNPNSIENEDEELIDVGKKRKQRVRAKRQEEKKIKLERIHRARNYYRGTYYGKSIAGVMYHLAQQLNRENLDFLWYWIVGITDQLIHNRISYTQYGSFISECYNEVLRLNANIDKGSYEVEEEEMYENLMSNENLNPNPERRVKVESFNKKVGSILIERDLRFFLLRNWTLYDSMFYSNYVAAKLALWKERGKQELHKLIARIGVPLEEAKQQYKFMNNKLKKQLKEKVLDITDMSEYEFSDILIDSFVRQIDTKTQISASDLVFALSAILESPKDLETEAENIENILKPTMASQSQEEEKGSRLKNIFLMEQYEYNRIKNFWYAYESLAGNGIERLDAGISLAIEMQKKTMNEAIFLIEKKAIYSCSQFRYCIINSDTAQEKYFHHPLTIQKLAILIMTFFKEQKKNEIPKPFLVCVHNNKVNTYMVVGISPFGSQLENELDDRNEFGRKFDYAAEKSSVRIKFDNFDSSIVEIHKDDFDTFFDELTEQR